MERYKTVDDYINGNTKWSEELNVLRSVLLESELKEEVKWGAPIYTLKGKNVVGLAAFKNHFAVWFHNGVFLKDKKKKLLNAQEGVTRGLRQWRFEEMNDIDPKILADYVAEAIVNEKAGKKISPKKSSKKLEIPEELQNALNENKDLESNFNSLTPYKQKEYAEHIGSAKQEKTRLNRLDKAIGLILEGKGLNDKYRNC